MVMKSSSQDRRPARERLLAAADELFYEEGFNLVGIDRVIERAGVAKASLYDCFGSKEELIRSYLQQRHEARQLRMRERLARYDHPQGKDPRGFRRHGGSRGETGFPRLCLCQGQRGGAAGQHREGHVR